MKIALTGKRAIAAVATASLLATGTTVVNAPVAFAQTQTAPTTSVTGEEPRKVDLGAGTLNPIAPVVQGGLMTISGTGFTPRSTEGAFLSFKINDGQNIAFPENQDGTDVVDVDSAGTAYFNQPNVPQADGTWSGTLRIPADLAPGYYWVRVLTGTDGDPAGQVSKFAWFEVVENDGSVTVETPNLSAQTRGFAVDANLKEFRPNERITATLDGRPVQFRQGSRTVDSVTVGANGTLEAVIDLSNNPLRAGQRARLEITGDQGTTESTRISGTPEITITSPNNNRAVVGSTIDITLRNLVPGSTVDNLGVLGINVLENHPDRGGAAANGSGELTIKNIAIPRNQALVGQELAVMVKAPGEDRSHRFDSGVKFSPAQQNNNQGGNDGSSEGSSVPVIGIVAVIIAVIAGIAGFAISQGLLPF